MAHATDQQLLLNVVRSRYRDAPYFLDVAGITASQTLTASASIGAEMHSNDRSQMFKPGAGVGYSETPTISYVPLEGAPFLKRLISPIPLEVVLVLSQSGWNAERLLGVAVERVNGLDNAALASGPTPRSAPRSLDFRRFAALWGLLQRQDRIQLGANPESTREILVRFAPEPYSEEVVEIKRMLGLPPERDVFRIGQNFLDPSPELIRMRTRSLMSVLFYLSQTVQVPEEHRRKGLVNVTQREDGHEFDWFEAGGRIFSVGSSAQAPRNAYLSVPYRGYWYSIPDDDLEAKSTFLLIDQLFNLQGGQSQAQLPTLTIPAVR
ncbi:MAG TPA: hypothetical protein VFB54_11790 [Burkholderiales bacterium]|nr:hypothetical protein [Burkholderiales bacterium]